MAPPRSEAGCIRDISAADAGRLGIGGIGEADGEVRRGYHPTTMGEPTAPPEPARDQLSLSLDAALPNLPAGLRPMLPRPLAEPFDSADHLFEPSWGGTRALAFCEAADRGGLRLVDPAGDDLAARLPELADLCSRLMARSAVIDGELVVVDANGRADRTALAARLANGSAVSAGLTARSGPIGGASREGAPPSVAYLVFDLLYLDGRPLLGEPLYRRRQALRRTLTPGESVVAVPAIAGEGRALHEAVVAQGIGGVMARQRASPYLPGLRSRLWRFIPADSPRKDPRGDATDASQGSLGLDAAAGGPSPVLALIRRLPLDDET
jgi:hypothetical protein